MNFYTIITCVLSVAIIIGYINHRFIKMETTTAIMLGSLIISSLLIVIGKFGFPGLEIHVSKVLSQISFRKLLINGMLSFLLFAGAMRIDVNRLFAQKWEIGTLAFLGTIASTILIATIIYYIFPLFNLHINYIYCLLFGALISPTDPIAVLALFKELGAPEKISVIVEGEALFNDGVGIVIFLTIYQLAFTGKAVTWESTTLLFLKQALGGMCYGMGIGLLAYWLIKPIDDHKIEILITLLIVTVAYTFANSIGISGALAMVVAGIFVGNRGRKFSMSKRTVESLDIFWGIVEEIINAALFLLIGLELLRISFDKYQLIAILMTIPLAIFVRFVTVGVPMSIFKIWKKYDKGTNRILIWGGLRGGLALALALSLPSGSYRNLILEMTYAVVVFAIIVQGMSIRSLIKLTKK